MKILFLALLSLFLAGPLEAEAGIRHRIKDRLQHVRKVIGAHKMKPGSPAKPSEPSKPTAPVAPSKKMPMTSGLPAMRVA